MSRMIPPRISAACKSPGERLLFGKFQDDPATADWIVLHSLDIARHVNQLEGEADFLVLVPDLGILCLEVKAGDVQRQNGLWIYWYGSDRKESRRSPFRQASEAMHSLRNYVSGRNALFNDLLFISAVAFTRIDFAEVSPEWHRWQYVDRKAVNRRPVSTWCVDILQNAHRHVSTQGRAGWYDPSKARPSKRQIEAIAELLRPDFEYFRLPQEEAKKLDDDIRRYTRNQFAALDSVEENPRTLFKGLAGTGKTMIAIEAARRALADNKRVLLVCFNNLLGEWLRGEAELLAAETGGDIESGTLHSVLLKSARIAVPDSADSNFWRKDLPAAAIDNILCRDETCETFDVLIVDECQDFNEEAYFDFLDLLLNGGLAGGAWSKFGDFDRQAIYGKELDIPELLKDRAPSHTVFRLTDNCRNTFPIAASIEALCSPEPRYREILHHGNAAQTEVVFYRDSTNQLARLESEIRRLLKIFNPSDIVILSVRASKKCIATCLKENKDIRLAPLAGPVETDSIRYGSIHAFKGLEAPAVVITDIGSITSEYEQSLLYVGMSRARQRLVLLLDDQCKQDYENAILKNLTKGRDR